MSVTSVIKGKSFFNHIMTVSNHRPYAYPTGRIDIDPAYQSIEGAVKYTDYAINKFILDARQKHGLIIRCCILADHCSKVPEKQICLQAGTIYLV
jgi:phosphoglycerol transferase MdoB-like AlkP superfamily enzyme